MSDELEWAYAVYLALVELGLAGDVALPMARRLVATGVWARQ
jgi:hypothetical protein